MPELIGLLVGLVAGVLFPWAIPSQYSLYVAAKLLPGVYGKSLSGTVRGSLHM